MSLRVCYDQTCIQLGAVSCTGEQQIICKKKKKKKNRNTNIQSNITNKNTIKYKYTINRKRKPELDGRIWACGFGFE